MTWRWRLRRAWRVLTRTAWETENLERYVGAIGTLGGPSHALRFVSELHELAAISTAQYREQLKRLGLEEP